MAGNGKRARYRFTFGPWNISMGADPFGPPVRKEVAFAAKLREYKKLGFDGVQFHDDDAVPDIDQDPAALQKAAARVKKVLDGEGTYVREAKDPIASVGRIVDAINALLEYDKNVRILGEMKPNEPMDQAYLPTPGHFLALSYRTAEPSRVGVLIESAHSILAGLDPSEDMAYTLWHGKLWSVHLNDQNGLKYDQDKSFGSVDLRRAFNTVWVLERAGYDGCIGLDVKAMRTTRAADQTKHLANSRTMFLRLLEVARGMDANRVESYRADRDYEGLEMYILEKLMGK